MELCLLVLGSKYVCFSLEATIASFSKSCIIDGPFVFNLSSLSCRPSTIISSSLEQGHSLLPAKPRRPLQRRPQALHHQQQPRVAAGELRLPSPPQLLLRLQRRQLPHLVASLGNEVEPQVRREEVLLLRACITTEKGSIREPSQVNTHQCIIIFGKS